MLSSQSRVWLTIASPDHDPVYYGRAIVSQISSERGGGESTIIPNDFGANRFITTPQQQFNLPSGITATIQRRAVWQASVFHKMETPFDIHVIQGVCRDPSAYQFDKLTILHNATITRHAIDKIGTLSENGVVDETIDIAAQAITEMAWPPLLIPITIETTDVYGNTADYVKAIDICPIDETLIFVLVGNNGDYCNPVLCWSDDNFNTYTEVHIPSELAAEAADNAMDGQFCDDYYYAIESESGRAYRVHVPSLLVDNYEWDIIELSNGGLFANPTAINGVGTRYVFCCGDNGAIWRIEGTEADVLYGGGELYSYRLFDISVLSNNAFIACGENNTVIYSYDANTVTTVKGPAEGQTLYSCKMLSKRTWLIGTEGAGYYTVNGGLTWRPLSLSSL